jgi:hypothetical protein
MKVAIIGGSLSVIPGISQGKKFISKKEGISGVKYNIPVKFTDAILEAMEKGMAHMATIRVPSKERS